MPARRSTSSPARPILRYREALGEDDRPDPGGPLSRRLSEAGRRGAGPRARQRAASAMPEAEWLPIVRDAPIDAMMAMIRDDLEPLDIDARCLLLGALADQRQRERRRGGDRRAPRQGARLSGPPAAAEGPAARGLGGPRADAVPRHRLRRRRRPAADQVRRQLHLFRLRHRLSLRQVPARLPQSDRCLGRRPWRLCQAHAGGGRGDHATARPRST